MNQPIDPKEYQSKLWGLYLGQLNIRSTSITAPGVLGYIQYRSPSVCYSRFLSGGRWKIDETPPKKKRPGYSYTCTFVTLAFTDTQAKRRPKSCLCLCLCLSFFLYHSPHASRAHWDSPRRRIRRKFFSYYFLLRKTSPTAVRLYNIDDTTQAKRDKPHTNPNLLFLHPHCPTACVLTH